MKFRTSTLLLLTAFFAAIVWCLSGDPMVVPIERFIVSLVAIGVTAALRFRNSRPLSSSALCGASFAAVVILVVQIASIWGYQYHDNSYPYFEEGIFIEVFVVPIIGVAIFCPAAAAVSFVSGWAVSLFVN